MSILIKPRGSDSVRVRNTAAMGVFARRYSMPRLFASDWFNPTRASSGSVNMQYGTRRFRVVRLPPVKLSRTMR